ncbi:MAG: DNA pilot protein [Microviridae sp.]|nr:MAG: DNA pilot protein [Microviridae sp.]
MSADLAMMGASGGSSLLGTWFKNREAKKASARQMAFQERMRETQYQTAVEDMRKAGINPMLAVSQGGAGTPSGSTYVPENMGTAAAQGMAQGAQAYTARMQGDLTKYQAKQEKQVTEYLETNNMNIVTLKKSAVDLIGHEAWLALKSVFDPDPKAKEKLPPFFQDIAEIGKKFLIQEGFAIPAVDVAGGVSIDGHDKGNYTRKTPRADKRGNFRPGVTFTGKTPTSAQILQWLGILKLFRTANKGGIL